MDSGCPDVGLVGRLHGKPGCELFGAGALEVVGHEINTETTAGGHVRRVIRPKLGVPSNGMEASARGRQRRT